MTPQQYTLCSTLARWLPGRYGDAVAALVDRASELASEVEELREGTHKRDRVLNRRAIQILVLKAAVRKVAVERDALESQAERAESLSALVEHWRARAEVLESRPIVADKVATPALVRLAFAARQIRALIGEGGGIQSHAHSKPGIWDDNNSPDRAGKRCEQCSAVLEFTRAVDGLSDADVSPIHPALVRLADAAKKWRLTIADTKSGDAADEILNAAILDLHSPLPTVVTCGECRFNGQDLAQDTPDVWCPHHREYYSREGFCHLGKRRAG